MTLGATADFERFDEAVEWFTARVTITKDEADALALWAKQRAWWLSDVAQARMVQDVQDSLGRALESGADFKAWQKEAIKQLADAWTLEGEAAAFRVETIWRNAAQNAYSRGRWEQMRKPLTMKVRPFWMYDAILDGRTSDLCKQLDGTILPADDPWWDSHYPPVHHRCRSTVRALRPEEAQRRGVNDGPPVDEDGNPIDPQDGFGWSPDARDALDELDAYLDGLDPELSRDVVRKFTERRDEESPIDIAGTQP